MKRYAIYYESRLGRNDGNPLYTFRGLKRRQEKGLLEVDHLAPTGDLSLYGKYDAHIWVDWGEDGLTGLLPYEPIYPPGHPLIYWASDTHLGYEYRLNCARQADIVFCAQKKAVDAFKSEKVNATWLPHAIEPEAYPKLNLASKKYDVCFVGHVNSGNRIDALDKVFKAFPNFYYGQQLFENAARKYAESRVVFNISMNDDLNMRVFEVLGSGSLLVTDKVNSIDELFKDGVHLITYMSVDEAVDKIRYYLRHDEEREKIALNGYNEVMKNHTFDKRIDEILKSVEKEVVHG